MEQKILWHDGPRDAVWIELQGTLDTFEILSRRLRMGDIKGSSTLFSWLLMINKSLPLFKMNFSLTICLLPCDTWDRKTQYSMSHVNCQLLTIHVCLITSYWRVRRRVKILSLSWGCHETSLVPPMKKNFYVKTSTHLILTDCRADRQKIKVTFSQSF